MSIVSTAGSATADSYADIATADAYAAARLYATAFSDATTDFKERALKMATRELDKMNWLGDIVDTTTPQALRWPRSSVTDLDGTAVSSTTIPQFLEEATIELALELLKKDRYAESDSKGIRKVQAGAVAVSFDRKDTSPRNSITVMQLISHYLEMGSTGSYTLLNRA